jgi:hypothetical protein
MSQGQSMDLQWNIGESIIETGNSASKIFSQGFVQPIIIGKTNADFAQSGVKSNVLRITPNPTTSYLNVTIIKEVGSGMQFQLYNGNGQPILQVQTEKSEESVSMDLSALPSGLYLLRVSSTDGSVFETHRIIKI